MKKKIVALMLCALIAMPMIACGGKEVGGSANPELGRVVNGFENFQAYYYFDAKQCALRQNADAAYVTEGSASLMLDVYGDFRSGTTPPSIGFALDENGEAVDLTKLKSFTFDLFNMTEKEQTVDISLTVDGVKTGVVKQTIAVGKNEVRYAPDMRGLSALGDLTKGEKINIVFSFPERDEPARRFYLDNLKLNENIRVRAPMEMNLDENEFCSFDKDWQAYVNGTEAVGPSADCLPKFEIDSDVKYCKNNVGRSLKVTLPTGTAPMSDGWPCMTFLPALVKKFDWKSLMENNAELVFDVYNPSYRPQRFSFHIFNSPTYAETHFTTNKINTYSMGFTANHGWTEVRVPIGEIDKKPSYPTDSRPLLLSDNVTAIGISYGKFAEEDKTIWFDDFRFEYPQSQGI